MCSKQKLVLNPIAFIFILNFDLPTNKSYQITSIASTRLDHPRRNHLASHLLGSENQSIRQIQRPRAKLHPSRKSPPQPPPCRAGGARNVRACTPPRRVTQCGIAGHAPPSGCAPRIRAARISIAAPRRTSKQLSRIHSRFRSPTFARGTAGADCALAAGVAPSRGRGPARDPRASEMD